MAIEKRIGAYSAYAIAVKHGFVGTEEEWLESLIGPIGYQGWGISAVNVSADGSLIFTVENPETGETRELEPIQIETLNALDSISTAKDEAVNEVKETQTQATEAVGTAKTQAVQAVEDAENTGVSAVEDAKSNALTEVGEVKTTAVDAVNAAGTQATSAAKTAITGAKNQAVSDVQTVGQAAVSSVGDAQTEAVEAVETSQTNAVQAVQDAGADEVEKINGILPVPTAEDAGKVPISKPDGSGYELERQIDDGKTSLDTAWSSQNILSRLCPPFEVSDSIVTCNPVESSQLNVLVQIKPVQEGTGDPSPENVRPIKGFDAVNICRCGKNLLSFTGEIVIPKDKYDYGTRYTYPDLVTAVERLPRDVPVYFKADWSHFTDQGATKRISLYTEDSFANFDENKANTIPHGNISDVLLYAGLNKGEDCTVSNICVTVGNEEYEPYRGETFTIQLGQTVYGGTLDVTTGVLTKTHENIPSYAGEDVGDDWMSSTGSLTDGAQVVYRLKNPVSTQLTPQEILALSGENTIYADTGNVTVSGYSDPKNIINTLADRIAALEQNAIGG